MQNTLNLGSRVGLKALTRSAVSYSRALQDNVGFIPAALALAEVELALLDTARLQDARDVLRRVSLWVTPGPPELLLALGRVERAAGSLDSAAVVFERYLIAGPNRALGLLELARTRLALRSGPTAMHRTTKERRWTIPSRRPATGPISSW